MPSRQTPASDRLRRVSLILRVEIGSCAGFSAAKVSPNDHTFGIAELIEVKLRQICERWGKHRVGHSAAGRANRQRCSYSGRALLLFGLGQPLRKLRRCFEFRRQTSFQHIDRKPVSGQKPVKFRRREIEIFRDLIEVRPFHAVQLVHARASGNDGSQPPHQTASQRSSIASEKRRTCLPHKDEAGSQACCGSIRLDLNQAGMPR